MNFNTSFASSESGDVVIKNHSTSNIVEVIVHDEENADPYVSYWFSYAQFRNLIEAIKGTSNE